MDKERLVRDIYHKGVILCKPDTPLQEVVRVMADTEIHAVMVAEREGEPPVGVVSHTDAIAHYGEDLATIQARDVMRMASFLLQSGLKPGSAHLVCFTNPIWMDKNSKREECAEIPTE